ncbi:hypothetical protein PG993_003106 [Apiospora rasikravindrae]|uniref:Uncharacterized protein n=1 Tax=Apiospora rasikravindrae TaxID=990691 RepID=A0ABR1TYI6_9PEZI
MVDQASPERSEDYTLSDPDSSGNSVESTIHVATHPPNMGLKRKRRVVAIDSESEEGTISPVATKSKRDESVDNEKKDDSSLQAPGLYDESATASSPLSMKGEENGGGYGEGQGNWDINTSTIQGLVSLMDKNGKDEQRRRLNAERKLLHTQRSLSDARRRLSNEQRAHAEADSKIQDLSRQVTEYKQVIEASRDAKTASQERETKLKEDNAELRLQCDIKDKRLAEAKSKHETNHMAIERLERRTASPEEVAQLRETIAEQKRAITALQGTLKEKEDQLNVIQGTFKR